MSAIIANDDFNGNGEWDRLIAGLIGRVRYLKLNADQNPQPYRQVPDLRDWHWVTKKSAWVVGRGVPAGHAQPTDRTVIQLSREDDEYLLFGTPLRGNFSVECECSGFGFKDCHPFVAGKWLAPVYTHDTAWMGDVVKSLPNITLHPKLSQVDDGMHASVKTPVGNMGIAFVAPRITLMGDFDITADYANLQMEIPDEGACGVYQSIVFPSLANA